MRVNGARYDRWSRSERPGVVRILYWGDEVDVVDLDANDDPAAPELAIRYYDYARGEVLDGTIDKRKVDGRYRPLRFRDDPVLEVTFVDVQQGDATFILLPSRRLLVVDGGEGPFLARLLASVNPGTTAADPLLIDALVITHGDADHFEGLTQLAAAAEHFEPRKQLHARLLRYFHNGLVKAPSSAGTAGAFGASRKVGSTYYAIELHDDPRHAADPNRPFTEWNQALDALTAGVADMAPPEVPVIRRIGYGDDDVFDPFRPEVDIQVLGPITELVDGTPALPYLRDPHGVQSPSHTINGHSVVLRLTYGNVSFLLGGDLNIDSERRLRLAVEADPSRTLRAEVLKVPHHGSHEFEQVFLDAVNPVVSVVSSGDENAAKEYVHPRAVLMAALGKASRPPLPLLFSTELSAFFAYRGFIHPEQHRNDEGDPVSGRDWRPDFFAHERLVFGLLRVRTDGVRVLCATESASARIKEAYAFTVDAGGNVAAGEWSLV